MGQYICGVLQTDLFIIIMICKIFYYIEKWSVRWISM